MAEIKSTPPTAASFPLLPFELRDKIWDLAIRPRRPGAHFFTLYNRMTAGQMDAHAIAMDKTSYWGGGGLPSDRSDTYRSFARRCLLDEGQPIGVS